MIRILTHTGDQVRATGKVFLEVTQGALSLSNDEQAYFKAAQASKRKVGAEVRRVGRRVLIDEQAFFAWVDQQKGNGK